jgi:hypothetical protein
MLHPIGAAAWRKSPRAARNRTRLPAFDRRRQRRGSRMKGALAWLIGIPIPIIVLLYLLDVF